MHSPYLDSGFLAVEATSAYASMNVRTCSAKSMVSELPSQVQAKPAAWGRQGNATTNPKHNMSDTLLIAFLLSQDVPCETRLTRELILRGDYRAAEQNTSSSHGSDPGDPHIPKVDWTSIL